MNHPRHNVIDEIRWMADLGLDFVDLTIEPPAAASWNIDPEKIRKVLDEVGIGVVGHTAYYLAIESPFEQIRQGAVAELVRCLELFSTIGAKWMNVHPGRYTPMQERAYFISRDIESFEELLDAADRIGLGVMVENIPGDFNTVAQLGELLDPLPQLGLHLDIGHCNLDVEANTAPALIATYGERIRHVHLHDNKGGTQDLHLPLGAGTMDWQAYVLDLKRCGYNGTITLEVFSKDHHYLSYSRDRLRQVWDDPS